MIRLDLLGKIDLTLANGVQVSALLKQPKRLALLAYLATPAPGTWHRRDTLLALFWPDLDTARARTSLRNALYVLRQTLGDGVLVTRGDEDVSIDATAFTTDVAEVRMALRAGRPGDALQQYRGEMLPGLHPPDSDGFQRWLDGERNRLSAEIARAGVEWAATLETAGRLSEALAATQRVLEIQPDDETAVRRLMHLHDAIGDRAGGLAVFERYRSRLASEFDAEPAPETLALAQQLRSITNAGREAAARAPRPASLDPGTPAPPSFVQTPTTKGARVRWRALGLLAAGVALIVAARWVTQPAEPLGFDPSLAPALTEGDSFRIEPAISRDCKRVAYTWGVPTSLRIVVQDVARGSAAHALTTDDNPFELRPRWSPTRDELVFLSHDAAYVVADSGGAPRSIFEGRAGDGTVQSAAWSPSGDSVAVVRNDTVGIVSRVGGPLTFVGVGRQLHSCVWSPNGVWIACVSGNWVAFTAGPLFGNRAPTSIVLYPAAGGAPVLLTGTSKEYESPEWSEDGKFLWVVSNKDLTPGDVYAIPIARDGEADGPAVRITTGQNVEAISLCATQIAYSVRTRRENVWSIPIGGAAPIGLASASLITSGKQVIEVPRASPDGQWLIYDSDSTGNADLFRIPIGGGTALRLTADTNPEFTGDFSPDNHEIAFHRWINGERHVVVKDLERDHEAEVFKTSGDRGTPRWSPDGHSLAAWSHQIESGFVFVVHRDSLGRWQPEAWRIPDAQLPAWSPDGRTIAFVRLDGSIHLIPADSGAIRDLYAPRPRTSDPLATYLNWNPKAGGLWFLGHDVRGHSGIWSVGLRGEPPRLLADLDDPAGMLSGIAFTVAGQRFLFTRGERISNIGVTKLEKR